MVDPLWLLPSVLVVVSAAAWILDRTDGRGERAVARTARVLFGRFVSENADRQRTIQAAYVDTTYRTYAAKTLLFTALALVGGAAGGAYLGAGLLAVLEPLLRLVAQLPDAISGSLGLRPDFRLVLSGGTRWAIVLGGGLVTGVLLAIGAYAFRWKLPESHAEVRRRSIEEGLPRTTAFMYALSRGGVGVPDMFRTLGENKAVYGEPARELTVATREMDLFGTDMITAVRRMTRRTPSEQFKTFGENLASVLQSGSSLSAFFREQYDRFQAEAEERQQELLEFLATIAEGYVTVLVAGMLFLITILMVFGLTTTDTLWLIQLMAYLVIPLANAGFVVYLDQQLEAMGIGARAGTGLLAEREVTTPTRPRPAHRRERADGGVTRDRTTATQLRWYDRVRWLKGVIRRPLGTVLWNPGTILYVTVPLAVLYVGLRAPAALQGNGLNVRIVDDLLVQSTLFVLGSYAVVRTLYKRRIDKIEAATPELLERLASLNEAGMTVVEGFDRVRGSDLGVLTPEVERIWRDIEYGANVDDALIRFGRRVRTASITRVVTLLTNAMRASGQMGDVLRIAGDQARADLRMRRQRRRQMLTYLLVIYISFLVFLVIILAVKQVLVPSLPSSIPTPDPEQANRLGVSFDQFTRLGRVNKAAYTLIFFHTALVQAVCSGFVGGQLGEGSLKDGAKHAAVLLAVAYIAFALLSAPVASIDAGRTPAGEGLTVDSASLSKGGFLVVHDDSINGTVLGRSEYLAPGAHTNVTIETSADLRPGQKLVIVPHLDTNDNRRYDYHPPPWIPSEDAVDEPYSPLASGSTPGDLVEVRTRDD